MDAETYNRKCANETRQRRSQRLAVLIWSVTALAALTSPLWIPWVAHLLRGK